jgi:hypothetical protein
LILLVGFVFLARSVRAEEEPTISLVKNIVIREYKGENVRAEVHEVQPGDSLIQLLNKRGLVNRLYLTPADRELLRALNPKLKDLNLIVSKQKVLLPTAAGEKAEAAAAQPAAPPAEKASPAAAPAVPDIPFRVHRVSPGENLTSILAKNGLTDMQAMLRYIDLIKKLNPNLKNVHWIHPNQKLRIPVLEKAAEEAQAEAQPAPAVARLQKPAPSAPAVAKTPTTEPEAKKEAALPPAPPEAPDSETLARHAALGVIFTRIGERFTSTGQHYLPLRSGDQLTLKASTFPILRLRSGHRIILDLSHRLPDKMIELIRQQWAEYSVFQSQPGEDFRALLERLFKACGYFRLIGRGQAYTLDRPIKLILRADFVLFPSEADLSAGRAVLVTLPAEPRLGTYPEAAAFLTDKGVRVIDFFPKGNMIGPSPWTPQARTDETAVRQVKAETVLDLLKAVLDLLNLKYEADLSLPIAQKSQTDFELNVQASLYFNHNQTNYLVRLQPLTQQVSEALEKQAIRAVLINPDGDPLDQAAILLRAMKQEFQRTLTLPASDRPADQSPAFVLSGLLIPRQGERLFLTRTDIPDPLLDLFSRAKVRAVRIVSPEKTTP